MDSRDPIVVLETDDVTVNRSNPIVVLEEQNGIVQEIASLLDSPESSDNSPSPVKIESVDFEVERTTPRSRHARRTSRMSVSRRPIVRHPSDDCILKIQPVNVSNHLTSSPLSNRFGNSLTCPGTPEEIPEEISSCEPVVIPDIPEDVPVPQPVVPDDANISMISHKYPILKIKKELSTTTSNHLSAMVDSNLRDSPVPSRSISINDGDNTCNGLDIDNCTTLKYSAVECKNSQESMTDNSQPLLILRNNSEESMTDNSRPVLECPTIDNDCVIADKDFLAVNVEKETPSSIGKLITEKSLKIDEFVSNNSQVLSDISLKETSAKDSGSHTDSNDEVTILNDTNPSEEYEAFSPEVRISSKECCEPASNILNVSTKRDNSPVSERFVENNSVDNKLSKGMIKKFNLKTLRVILQDIYKLKTRGYPRNYTEDSQSPAGNSTETQHVNILSTYLPLRRSRRGTSDSSPTLADSPSVLTRSRLRNSESSPAKSPLNKKLLKLLTSVETPMKNNLPDNVFACNEKSVDNSVPAINEKNISPKIISNNTAPSTDEKNTSPKVVKNHTPSIVDEKTPTIDKPGGSSDSCNKTKRTAENEKNSVQEVLIDNVTTTAASISTTTPVHPSRVFGLRNKRNFSGNNIRTQKTSACDNNISRIILSEDINENSPPKMSTNAPPPIVIHPSYLLSTPAFGPTIHPSVRLNKLKTTHSEKSFPMSSSKRRKSNDERSSKVANRPIDLGGNCVVNLSADVEKARRVDNTVAEAAINKKNIENKVKETIDLTGNEVESSQPTNVIEENEDPDHFPMISRRPCSPITKASRMLLLKSPTKSTSRSLLSQSLSNSIPKVSDALSRHFCVEISDSDTLCSVYTSDDNESLVRHQVIHIPSDTETENESKLDLKTNDIRETTIREETEEEKLFSPTIPSDIFTGPENQATLLPTFISADTETNDNVNSISKRQLRKLSTSFNLKKAKVTLVKLRPSEIESLINACRVRTNWADKEMLTKAGLSTYDVVRLGLRATRKTSEGSRYGFRKLVYKKRNLFQGSPRKKRDKKKQSPTSREKHFVKSQQKRLRQLRDAQRKIEAERRELESIRRSLLKINAKFLNQNRFWNALEK